MGPQRIVIDTNILISALGWEGPAKTLLREVADGKHTLILSEKQIQELTRVIEYPKFNFSKLQKKALLDLLFEIATVIKTKRTVDVLEDKADNMLLECADEGKAEYIISGDKEVLELKTYKSTKIVSVREFLKS